MARQYLNTVLRWMGVELRPDRSGFQRLLSGIRKSWSVLWGTSEDGNKLYPIRSTAAGRLQTAIREVNVGGDHDAIRMVDFIHTREPEVDGVVAVAAADIQNIDISAHVPAIVYMELIWTTVNAGDYGEIAYGPVGNPDAHPVRTLVEYGGGAMFYSGQDAIQFDNTNGTVQARCLYRVWPMPI